MKLLLASGNRHKLKEFQQLLLDRPHVTLLTPADVGLADLHVVEDGTTFAENARLKAQAYAAASQLPVLADDSGIEVDYLDGAPGIYSARYAGEHGNDEDNNRKLLDALADVPETKRSARYRIALVYLEAGNGGTTHLIESACEGHIVSTPIGSGGFGYDPLFRPLGHHRTMAQLPPNEKAAISHRGRASREMAAWLRQHLAGRP